MDIVVILFIFQAGKEYIPVSLKNKCIIPGCENPAQSDSVYCSEQCIVQHAEESIVALEKEKQKRFGSTKMKQVCIQISHAKPQHKYDYLGSQPTCWFYICDIFVCLL